MVDIEKIAGWLKDYADLKRQEAKRIEENYGKGWISDAKFDVADEVESWVKNVGRVDEPTKVSACMTPDNFKVSDVFPNNSYVEYQYADGTVRRVCEFKR